MPVPCKNLLLKIIFTGILFVQSSSAVFAEDDPAWIVDRNKLQSLSGDECQRIWDILWPWAKKGNLEARLILLGFVQWGVLTTPGHSDLASRLKDMTVLTIHSSGYKGDIKNIGAEDPRLTTFESADFQMIYKDYLECHHKNDSIICADKAVANGLVAPFSVYAKEIDDLSTLGYRVSCLDSENRKKAEKTKSSD